MFLTRFSFPKSDIAIYPTGSNSKVSEYLLKIVVQRSEINCQFLNIYEVIPLYHPNRDDPYDFEVLDIASQPLNFLLQKQ